MEKIKNWFKNYWYYYKIPVFFGAFFLIAGMSFLIEYITAPKYDLNIIYIGEKNFEPDALSHTAEVLSKYTPDLNGNGESLASFISATVTEAPKTEEELASMEKAFIEITSGEKILFMMDKKLYDGFAEEGLFCDISKYTESDTAEYGISLEGNRLADELRIKDAADVYLAVRVLTAEFENDEKKIAEQQGAFQFIKTISENLK